jgi:hypothetical protein
LKDLAQISLHAYEITYLQVASPMPISEERKTNARKLSSVFCCARCCETTIMIRVEEKKENHMVDIK